MLKLLMWAVIGFFAYQYFWKGQKRIDKQPEQKKRNETIIDIDYEEIKD